MQLVAAAGWTLAPPRPDDSHGSLEWLATERALVGLPVGGTGTVPAWLRLADLTLLLATLTQFLQAFEKYRMLVFGPLLIIFVMYFPGGITGSLARLRARRALASVPRGVAAEREAT